MPLFTDLDCLRADLDALRPLAPEQEARVLQKFRLEWNYNSNAIEGNSLTLGETRSLLLHGVAASGKSIRDHDDIRNHNKVVAEVELLSTETRPVTEHLIREMHEILLGREPYYVEARTADGAPTRQLIQPGTYKRNPNQALTATGERIFFASPEETPAEMTALLAWYREQEEATPTIHPVALAAEFHYRFVRIHPFDDGNGRMSRLLMNLILLRHGYPMTVIQAADRNRYLAALAEADAGEPEPFLRFVIENVEAGLRLMIRAARGESIDEPNDLEKKWAILRRQVLTRTLPQSTIWNLATQVELYEKAIAFWFTDLASLVQQADELFTTSGVLFACLGPQTQSNNGAIHTIDTALEFARACFLGAYYTLDEASFIFRWNDFKHYNNSYKLRLIVSFYFNQEGFIAKYRIGEPPLEEESTTWPVVFESDYKIKYDHAQIHEINYQLANKVYDFIAAKLAEADTPTA